MRTQCPNPACKLLFEVPDERGGKNEPCPQCGQVITLRPLEIIRKLEKQQADVLARQQQQATLGQAGPPAYAALLEDVRSLWNVGAIFRTADGAGFRQLYLSGITGCPPRKEIAKTSLGAEDHIPWSYVPHPLEILPRLRSEGVQIVGLERSGDSIDLGDACAQGLIRTPLCLVVGNEVVGLSAETRPLCHLICHLPMRGIKTSLNVAIAFGIAAYKLTEKEPAAQGGREGNIEGTA